MSLQDKLNEALDDEIDLDFSAAREELDFSKPVECREYEFEVLEATIGKSGSGNPKVAYKVRIVDECDAKGRTFFKHCPATGEGAGILREMIRALGGDPESKKLKPAADVGKHFLGTIRMQKGSEEYQEIVKPKQVSGKTTASGGSRRSRLS